MIKIRDSQYFINDSFEVISPKGKIMGVFFNKTTGYNYVTLRMPSGRKNICIHRIIAEAFIPNPDNLPVVNHKNTIKTDNRIDNLEWCTSLYNARHAAKNGLYKPRRGESSNFSKLSNNHVLEIRRLGKLGAKHDFLSKKFGVSQSNISEIISRKIWFNI